MTKIDASKWVNKPTYDEKLKQYKAATPYYQDGTSSHGKSTAYTACGFCETEHEVYIWSFIGCGKRCVNCGALICHGTSYAMAEKVKNMNPDWVPYILK